MEADRSTTQILIAASSLALFCISGMAVSAESADRAGGMGAGEIGNHPGGRIASRAQQEVDKAAQVVRRMERDPGAADLLAQSHGVLIFPDYGRIALGIGGRGGDGVLMLKKNGVWTDPAFYNAGGASIGAQVGAEGGALVFVLNNDKAVDRFMQNSNWSLSAEAGLTVAAWSDKVQRSAGSNDVIVWSGTKGLLGSVAISVTDIRFDQAKTSAFYGRSMQVNDVFSGGVTPSHDKIATLQRALSASKRT